MAVINLNTLVLRGVSVVRDVVAGRTGLGSVKASGQTPALPVRMRHPSQGHREADTETDPRQPHAANGGVNPQARRAGRLGGILCSLGRRSFALRAGGPGRMAPLWLDRFAVKPWAPVGTAYPTRLTAVRALGLTQASKDAVADRACSTQAGETLAASTRGSRES
jgi:hypothetical protein